MARPLAGLHSAHPVETAGCLRNEAAQALRSYPESLDTGLRGI